MPTTPERRCVHCLQVLESETRDHVFPKSWYPTSTEETVQRWTAPSCADCNRKYGELEKQIMLRMGLCIDPAKEEALGIADKAKRSMGVGVAGLPEKEAGHRERQKRKIIAGFKEYDPKLAAHILPGFGPHEGFEPREQLAVLVQASTLEEVIRKITRGCEYVFAERYIEEPYALEIWFPNPEGIAGAEAMLAGGTTDNLGPGITIKRRVLEEDSLSVFFGFRIWGTLNVFATILPPDAGTDNQKDH